MKKNLRKTGIDIIGNIPWGTHLCQFYKAKEDLLDILIPYFKTGLEDNEFCMWITSEPLEVEDAKTELRKAVKDLDTYIKKGQIEILDYSQWYTKTGKFEADSILQGWVEKEQQAIKNGFEGLRLTGNTFWLEKKNWKAFDDYERVVNNVIGNYKMLAICTYSLEKCDANEIISVVNSHQFALIERSGKWKVIESSERKKAEDASKESEDKYRSLFSTTPSGVAYCKILVDEDNRPIDFVHLEINNAWERSIGLKRENVVGRKITEVIPGIKKSKIDLISIYGRVALTGEPTKFNFYFEPLGKWFAISVYSPRKGYFVAVFEDITEQKKAEETIKNLARFPEENLNPVYRVSKDGVLLYANSASRRLVLEDQTKIGDKIPEKWIEMIKNAYDSGKKQQVELELSGRMFLFNLIPVIEGGYVNSYATDITERKKAEEEMRTQQEIVRTMKDGLVVIKPNGVLLDLNDYFTKMTGWTKEDLIGTRVPYKFWVKEEIPRIMSTLSNLQEKDQTVKALEQPLQKKDGGVVWTTVNSTILHDKEGRQKLFFEVFRDITNRKKAEERLKEHTLQLEQQKTALEHKNIAFREIIKEIEIEKNETRSSISNNINEFVIPTLKKLRLKGASRKYVKLLEDNLTKITSSFGSRITEKTLKLTPREIEICNMIKGNLSSKEIANLLNISSQTVGKHRKDIRKKIGISAKKLNLTSYLQSL